MDILSKYWNLLSNLKLLWQWILDNLIFFVSLIWKKLWLDWRFVLIFIIWVIFYVFFLIILFKIHRKFLEKKYLIVSEYSIEFSRLWSFVYSIVFNYNLNNEKYLEYWVGTFFLNKNKMYDISRLKQELDKLLWFFWPNEDIKKQIRRLKKISIKKNSNWMFNNVFWIFLIINTIWLYYFVWKFLEKKYSL